LKGGHAKPWFYNVTEPFFVWMTQAYENSLSSFLRVRWVAWVMRIGLFGGIYTLFQTGAIPSELAPLEDRGQMRISATAPEGSTFDYMLNFTDEITNFIMKEIPESERSSIYTITSPGFGNAGSNSGMIRILLSDTTKRRTQQEIVDAIQPKIKKFTGAKSIVIQEPTLQTGQRGGGGLPVAFVIQAPNFDKLKKMMPQFMAKVRESPKFEIADINLKFTKPELRLEIDRSKAQNLGV
jgi:multidrug efflux pump subunit AcrB